MGVSRRDNNIIGVIKLSWIRWRQNKMDGLNSLANLGIFIVIIFTVMMLGLAFYSDVNSASEMVEECKSTCSEYGYIFQEYYEGSGLKNPECWCKDLVNNEPRRVY